MQDPNPLQVSQRKTFRPARTTDARALMSGVRHSLLSLDGKSMKLTRETDASKTPPSRFQQRKGSLYATPGSRDGHVDKNYDRDAAYHAKLAEKGWSLGGKKRRGSKAGSEEGK